MGCFLACFGFTKKRKRRRNSSKIISEDHSYGKYVPLDSDVSGKLDIVEMPNPNASAKKLSDKPKESSTSKVKKKVSFNLNVRSYEPLPNDDYDTYLSGDEEKTIWEFNQEDRAGTSTLEFEEDSIASKVGSCSYPANYRYQNCRNSYDEEDEIELDESDFDEDDDDDDLDSDGEDDDDDNKKPNSASTEAEILVSSAQLLEERKCKLDQIQDSTNQGMSSMESNQSARNRSRDVHSVLNPVENLTQWKTIKAKSRQQSKQQKENIIVSDQQQQHVLLSSHTKKNYSGPLSSNTLPDSNHSKAIKKHGIAVDASLSNWLS